jgi:hypothetical protein
MLWIRVCNRVIKPGSGEAEMAPKKGGKEYISCFVKLRVFFRELEDSPLQIRQPS